MKTTINQTAIGRQEGLLLKAEEKEKAAKYAAGAGLQHAAKQMLAWETYYRKAAKMLGS